MLSFVGRSGSLSPFFTASTHLLASPAKAIVPAVLEKSKIEVKMDVDPKKPTLVTGIQHAHAHTELTRWKNSGSRIVAHWQLYRHTSTYALNPFVYWLTFFYYKEYLLFRRRFRVQESPPLDANPFCSFGYSGNSSNIFITLSLACIRFSFFFLFPITFIPDARLLCLPSRIYHGS